MSYTVYTPALSKMLTATLGNLTTSTLKSAAVTESYTFSADHANYSNISSYVLGTATLAGATVVNGVLDVDDFTFTGISAGTAKALIIYVDSGTANTSWLIGYDSSATNLPLTFTGASVLVTVNASGLLSLASA